jgi:hypothetical protein
LDFDATSQPPQSPPSSAEPFASQRIVRLLATTQTWCYVLACIGFGYVALTALRLGMDLAVAGVHAIESTVPVLVALAIAFVFYGLPSWMLLRYAQCIGRFRQSGDAGQLPRAFAAQRHFWIATVLAIIAVIGGVILVIGLDVYRSTMWN